jgi:MFS family permease
MAVAAAIAATGVVFAVLAERRPREHVRPPDDGAPSLGVLAVLATRGMPAGIFASIAVLSAADVFTAYLPLLADERGIAPSTVGILLAIRAATSMAARVGIGGVVNRVGRIRLIAVSAFVAGAALAGVGVTGSVALLALLSAAAGFALGFGQPLSMTIVVQLVPERARGTALALRLTGNRVGQVAAPAGAGLLAGATGTASVFWLLSAMLFASGVAIRPTAGRRDDELPLAGVEAGGD